MSAELVRLIKNVAMDAVRASRPVELMYGTVTKDYEHDGELCILLTEKLELAETFFVFGSIKPRELSRSDKLILIRMQGGQAYYVADYLGKGGD